MLIKKLFKSPLTIDTISLAVIKGTSMVTQLLVMPRLISTLGIDIYGKIAFIAVIMQYISFVCEFGYNFNATKHISDNCIIENINKVFTSVISFKIIISFILSILICIIFNFIQTPLSLKLLLSLLLYTLFLPFSINWLFLGQQKMKIPAIVSVIIGSVYIISIFKFINESSNFEDVIFIDCFVKIISILITFVYALCHYKLKIVKVDKEFSFSLFKESWSLFASSLSITLYRNINVVLLKLICGDFYAGLYASVEKVTRAFQAIIEPVTTSLFPFMSRKFKGLAYYSKILLLRKLSLLYFFALILLAIFIFIFNRKILFILNIEDPRAIITLNIMIIAIVAGSLNYLLGYVGMVNLNKNKEFRNSVFLVGLISVLLSPILIYLLNEYGAALSLAISEFILLLIIFYRLKK